MTDSDPSNIGPYRVLRTLGRGGMGTVYLCEHQQLGTRRAVKVVSFAGGEDTLGRFRLEAQVQSVLDHPCILKVEHFDLDQQSRPYLTMPYVGDDSGPFDLERLLREHEGSLDSQTTSLLIGQVLSGLAHAHDHGLVHRDLKPANVLIDRSQVDLAAKIVDFGVVRIIGDSAFQHMIHTGLTHSLSLGSAPTIPGMREPDDGPTIPENQTPASSTRSLIGTWSYMAPEQRRGGDADHRSDLYAVGLLAYRMLTGKLPEGFPRLPGQSDPSLSVWDTWLSSALESEPADRFQSALEALRRLPVAASGGPQKRRRTRTVALSMMVIVTGALGYATFHMIDSDSTTVRFPVPQFPEPVSLTPTPPPTPPPNDQLVVPADSSGGAHKLNSDPQPTPEQSPPPSSGDKPSLPEPRYSSPDDLKALLLDIELAPTTPSFTGHPTIERLLAQAESQRQVASGYYSEHNWEKAGEGYEVVLDALKQAADLADSAQAAKRVEGTFTEAKAPPLPLYEGVSGQWTTAIASAETARDHWNNGRFDEAATIWSTATATLHSLRDTHTSRESLASTEQAKYLTGADLAGDCWLTAAQQDHRSSMETAERAQRAYDQGDFDRAATLWSTADGLRNKAMAAQDTAVNGALSATATQRDNGDFATALKTLETISLCTDIEDARTKVYLAWAHACEEDAQRATDGSWDSRRRQMAELLQPANTILTTDPQNSEARRISANIRKLLRPRHLEHWSIALPPDERITLVFVDPPTETGGTERRVRAPVNEVPVAGYWIGVTEVTRGQWAALDLTPRVHAWDANDPRQPVTAANVDDAKQFCESLAQRIAGFTVRLPTRIEWEYACRAGSKTDIRHPAHSRENSEGKSHRVGSKGTNDWGLSDMQGNVSEWSTEAVGKYVVMGGHYGSRSEDCGCSNGIPSREYDTQASNGFRIVILQE